MSLYEYLQLTQTERAELLWSEGQFISSLVGDKLSYNLYSLFDFYAEVTLESNYIVDVTPFKQGVRLEKYLPAIELKGL